jgi:hypothetical protein
MSSLSALAIDTTARELPQEPRLKRLGDAEKIAAQRLDSSSISSLKAALAGVTAEERLQSGPRLVERIDAAARLAADATAAAEAVESLKRLLQAQLAASQPASTAVATAPLPTTSVPTKAAEPSAPAAASAEQRRPDVRGFLAGFVLSGAIGAVLYLYMMAG